MKNEILQYTRDLLRKQLRKSRGLLKNPKITETEKEAVSLGLKLLKEQQQLLREDLLKDRLVFHEKQTQSLLEELKSSLRKKLSLQPALIKIQMFEGKQHAE